MCSFPAVQRAPGRRLDEWVAPAGRSSRQCAARREKTDRQVGPEQKRLSGEGYGDFPGHFGSAGGQIRGADQGGRFQLLTEEQHSGDVSNDGILNGDATCN